MRIWLTTPNPLNLEEPPRWWQDLVFSYDKMLRIMPSQVEKVYRLCRVVRREARLGLQTMVVHKHPDTTLMIQHHVVPVSAVFPWAIRSTKIIRDLKARDTWALGGAEKVNQVLEQTEADQIAAQEREQDAHGDEIRTNMFRAVKYGRPETIHVEAGPKGIRRRQQRGIPAGPPPSGKIELAGKYTKIDSRLQNRVPSVLVK